MTKLKFTSLLLILSLLVVACGDSNETSSDDLTDGEELVTQLLNLQMKFLSQQ